MENMKKIEIKCKYCGKIFKDYSSNKRKYCSMECRNKGFVGREPWNKGIKDQRPRKPRKESTKEKIRKTLMGHLVSEETRERISKKNKGNLAWNKGIKWSEEVKEKIRQTNKRKKIEPKVKFVGFGVNHPGWKGGHSSENKRIRGYVEYRLWRESVFARDNWVCQKCKRKGAYLNAHHIKNFAQYPELRFAIDNGITLCKECHMKFHKKYGRKDNNREQLKEFLNL